MQNPQEAAQAVLAIVDKNKTKMTSQDYLDATNALKALYESPCVQEDVDFWNWSKNKLVEECKRLGLPSSGNKDVLAQRLGALYCNGVVDSEPDTEDFGSMTKKELQEACKTHGLSVNGNKPELQKRLEDMGSETDESEDFGSMTKKELQEACKTNGLIISGNKPELLKRLEDMDSDASDTDCTESEDYTEGELKNMSIAELKEQLADWQQKTLGTKEVLIKRILRIQTQFPM